MLENILFRVRQDDLEKFKQVILEKETDKKPNIDEILRDRLSKFELDFLLDENMVENEQTEQNDKLDQIERQQDKIENRPNDENKLASEEEIQEFLKKINGGKL